MFGRLGLLIALALFTVAPVHASPARPRWYAGAAFGTGVGDAQVEGARLEFGRGPAAFAVALRGGRVLRPEWLLGFHIDAVGAGSGDVVTLRAPSYGGGTPATTTHRVAVNHFSVVATWRPAGGPFFLRAGPGLAESFTEDWDAALHPVRRSFGPGVTWGAGYAHRLKGGTRVSLNADAMGGTYGSRSSWGAMVTLGFESY